MKPMYFQLFIGGIYIYITPFITTVEAYLPRPSKRIQKVPRMALEGAARVVPIVETCFCVAQNGLIFSQRLVKPCNI